jgi:hypothetical protein
VVLHLVMQIMLGNEAKKKVPMSFGSFQDGKEWYKDAMAMKPKLEKTVSGGLKEWAQLLGSNPFWTFKFFWTIMSEVNFPACIHFEPPLF